MSDARTESGCPEAVLASIAWYPDALDEERRGLVEAHAAACPACREEIHFVRGAEEPGVPLPDADAVYADVLARIEESDAGAAPRRAARAAPRRSAAGVPRAAALAAGIAVALLCGALGAVGGAWLAGVPPVYETARVEPTATPDEGVVLEVVFRPDAPVARLKDALRGIGGRIVSGPTQGGVYRVLLAPGADAAAAARVLQGDGLGVAVFAQPATR